MSPYWQRNYILSLYFCPVINSSFFLDPVINREKKEGIRKWKYRSRRERVYIEAYLLI